jgi:hypothetical protein
MLDNFMTNSHGKYDVDVFKEWLNVPYVHKFLSSGQHVFSRHTKGLVWVSAAHAMASCNRAALLDALLSRFPDIKDKKVTSIYFS